MILRYLLLAPTNGQVWHKTFFLVGPGAGPKPTSARYGPKFLRPRRHFSYNGCPKGVKALGNGPPEAEGNLQLPRHTWPDSCRSKHGLPKSDPTTDEVQYYDTVVFDIRPTTGGVWHKAFFQVGPGAGPKPIRARHFQKCLRPLRHSPY